MPVGVYDHYKTRKPLEMRYCKCGCGFSKQVKITSIWKYKSGHNPKVNSGRKLIRREERECPICNELFYCKPSARKRFCCHSCASKYLIDKGISGMRGRKHKDSTIKLMSKAKVDAHKSGKYTDKTRELIKLARSKQVFTEESQKRKSKTLLKFWKENKNSPIILERNKKLRQAIIKQAKLNYGNAVPFYNIKACELFKSIDERDNTEGHYAVYGGGEYYIKELGYWLDYINFDIKIIREYDEKHHYDKNGNLRPKDVKRQAEIQALFPDFKFERIKEV